MKRTHNNSYLKNNVYNASKVKVGHKSVIKTKNKNDKREKEILNMANGVFHRYDKTMRELAKI